MIVLLAHAAYTRKGKYKDEDHEAHRAALIFVP